MQFYKKKISFNFDVIEIERCIIHEIHTYHTESDQPTISFGSQQLFLLDETKKQNMNNNKKYDGEKK